MFLKIALLYALILLGYVLQKWRPIDRQKLSSFLLGPALTVFVFGHIALSDLSFVDIGKPVLIFICACLVAGVCYFIAPHIWNTPEKQGMRRMVASAVGNANTGYFGIPIALLLFTPDLVASYLLTNFGIFAFMLSVGYCLYDHHAANIWHSFLSLLKLPAFLALVMATLLNYSNIALPELVVFTLKSLSDITGLLFSIGGMAIIGIGLADLNIRDVNWKTIFYSNVFCFVLWPLVVGIVLFLDDLSFNLIQAEEHKIFWLMAFCPIGANAVLYATHFDLHPKQAALMVFSSTLIALPILSGFVLYLR